MILLAALEPGRGARGPTHSAFRSLYLSKPREFDIPMLRELAPSFVITRTGHLTVQISLSLDSQSPTLPSSPYQVSVLMMLLFVR